MAPPQEVAVADTGITVLNPELTPNETLVDIVFIHGLGGHPRGTWTYNGPKRDPDQVFGGSQQEAQRTQRDQGDQLKPEKKPFLGRLNAKLSLRSRKKYAPAPQGRVFHEDKARKPAIKENEFFWPQRLPETCARTRVMTFGYDSKVSHFFGGAANQNRFYDHAQDLLGALVRARTEALDRPLVFVAHSLGGLVIKQMLFDASISNAFPERKQVYSSTKEIFFLGTPHRGSGWAGWGEIARGLAGIIFDTNSSTIKHLKVDNESLVQLEKNFESLVYPRSFFIKTFVEAKGFMPVPILNSKIVNDNYAKVGDPGRERVFTINADHTAICRFWGIKDPGYGTVAGELGLTIGQIEAMSSQRREIEDKAQRQDLLKGLDYEGRRNREYQIWNVRADAETVRWIWDSSYVSWTSKAGGLFWICGKPASGKSTLMESMARTTELEGHLRRGLDCEWTIIHHFFDFRAGKDIGNNFEGFLRSLLHQLVDKSRDHEDVIPDQLDLPTKEPKQQWSIRELEEAMSLLLRQLSSPLCILLDGLDEYDGDKWSLANFLCKTAAPRVKICIASRPDPVFNVVFKDLPTIKMEEQNFRAIDTMVRQHIQCMAGSGFYDTGVAVEFASIISKMAKGVFLWARFAVAELRDGLSEGVDLSDLYKKLDNFPQELEDIYARILQQLKPEYRQRTTHMLQLVCYAQNTFTLRELYVATAHATSEQGLSMEQTSRADIQRFEKRVLALTGGMLEMFPNYELLARQEADTLGDFEYRSRISSGVDPYERWEVGNKSHSQRIWKSYENDPYENPEIDGAEPHASSPPNEDTSDKFEKVEDLLVSVIHRTFRTYMESTGWSQLLGAAHQGMLHAHVLWLRVCAEIFPPSFKWPPPEYHSNGLVRRRTQKDSPLLEYAVFYILTHAFKVEQDLGIDSFELLQPSLSESFILCHQGYCRKREGYGCACAEDYLKPLHPLHLAIRHGLAGYVKRYLSTFCEHGSHDWDQVSYYEVPYHTLPYYARNWPDSKSTFRISLLEYTIRSTRNYRISRDQQNNLVAVILNHYPRVRDADLISALEDSSADVVQLLIPYIPNEQKVFNSIKLKTDVNHREDIYTGNFFTGGLLDDSEEAFDVGPLWYIARRLDRLDLDNAVELIDLFLRRGEEINEQCGPFGTALHGSILRLHVSYGSTMWKLLVSKGADINAVGPFGTPLELVWRLANATGWTKYAYGPLYSNAIKWLIENGATNNQHDPNGSVPSREQMLSFAKMGKENPDDWEKIERYKHWQRVYRGDPVSEESDAEDEGDE